MPHAKLPCRPTFFLAGYQKTASTWLYQNLREHPEIFAPDRDEVHFFDNHYHRGMEWYLEHFEGAVVGQQIGDFTPSYLRFHRSRSRMVENFPNAKIIATLRNPIERAFSHYWHSKKKRKIAYDFRDGLKLNADIFDDWFATGFYDQHLEHLFTLVPRERVHVLVFEELETNAKLVSQSIFQFLNVDDQFVPSQLDTKINRAWFRPTWRERWDNLRRGHWINESEYDRGIDPEFREELRQCFAQSIHRTESLLDLDLSHWK